jgi:hypothetical protein
MRIGLAFRLFFKVLFDGSTAEQLSNVLDGKLPTLPQGSQPEAPEPAPKSPARSDALTLLAALQREARFVDIIQEPLDQYNDAQVGGAAREVLKDCGKVVQRIFDLQPVVAEEEGASVELSSDFDAGVYRLTGNVGNETPSSGSLVHHGWQANQCDVGQWSGSDGTAMIVAPAELEIK